MAEVGTRHYPVLRGRIEADAAVIGGGLSGLTCAVWLSRAGLKVVLLEAETLGFGASTHCLGMVSLTNRTLFHQLEKRAGVQTTQRYAQTMLRALQSVRQLAQAGQCGWQEVSACLVQSCGDQMLAAEAEAMKRAGIGVKMQRAENDTVLEIPHMGLLDCAKYLQYLAVNASWTGVRIFEGSRVTAFETNEAHTAGGVVSAPYIIVATGYPVINVPGWYFLKLRQQEGKIHSVQQPSNAAGMWFDVDGRYAIRAHADGACMLNWSGGMEKAETCGWECFTTDGLPYIGAYSSKTPNLFVATGYEGKGILGSMIAAHAISAQILGLPAHGYEIYSPQRRMSSLSVSLRIGRQYVKGMLARPSAPRCPHMGCRLMHNPRTRMWECPCHGSRFDDIGHVLSAPAVRDAVLQERRQKN